MTFSSAAVASYNPFSGTFHEVRANRPITVTPKDGELRRGSEGISPAEICCLYRPVFYEGLSNNPSDSDGPKKLALARSEEHTSELQSLMRSSYAVICLKKQ